MKPNEIKLRLIKIDGINVFFGKGVYDTETTLCTEKSRLKRNKSIYHISSEHIKRSKKGKALCIIDLSNHTSINEQKVNGTSVNPNSDEKDIKTINQIQYVTQKSNWEAHLRKMKMSIWTQLILIFCGMGILFFAESLLRAMGAVL